MQPMNASAAAPRVWNRVTLLQGESKVSRDPNVVVTTILGSCIACCLYDPVAKIGGMNHFLLSVAPSFSIHDRQEAQRYGVFAMEMLVNEMIKHGATRSGMSAHLYGGANMHRGMANIGTANAAFAHDFLEADQIRLAHADVGGTSARRLDFRAAIGQARCRSVDHAPPEPVPVSRPPIAKADFGDVELF